MPGEAMQPGIRDMSSRIEGNVFVGAGVVKIRIGHVPVPEESFCYRLEGLRCR